MSDNNLFRQTSFEFRASMISRESMPSRDRTLFHWPARNYKFLRSPWRPSHCRHHQQRHHLQLLRSRDKRSVLGSLGTDTSSLDPTQHQPLHILSLLHEPSSEQPEPAITFNGVVNETRCRQINLSFHQGSSTSRIKFNFSPPEPSKNYPY